LSEGTVEKHCAEYSNKFASRRRGRRSQNRLVLAFVASSCEVACAPAPTFGGKGSPQRLGGIPMRVGGPGWDHSDMSISTLFDSTRVPVGPIPSELGSPPPSRHFLGVFRTRVRPGECSSSLPAGRDPSRTESFPMVREFPLLARFVPVWSGRRLLHRRRTVRRFAQFAVRQPEKGRCYYPTRGRTRGLMDGELPAGPATTSPLLSGPPVGRSGQHTNGM